MAQNTTYDASSITVLEGLEAVRKRPGMYIGSVSTKGLNHLIYEIVDNAVDEHLAGYCSKITVILEKDGSATVSDNGRGIPVGMHEKGISAERLVFTTLHAGGKFDNNAYKTSGGLHGVGSSVVNALSKHLTVRVKDGKNVYEDTYEYGNPTTELVNGLLPVVGRTRETGTTISFLPDDTIFDKTRFKEDDIKSRLHETAYLNPALTIHFEDCRGTEPEILDYHEPEGIVGFIKDMNKSCEAVTDVISFQGESDGIAYATSVVAETTSEETTSEEITEEPDIDYNDPWSTPLTQAQVDKIMDVIKNTTQVARYDTKLTDIINEEAAAYFNGQKSLDETS